MSNKAIEPVKAQNTSPQTNAKRLLARRILNATVSTGGNLIVPGLGSLLDAIYSVTHPEQITEQMEKWRQETDQKLDDLADTVFPTIKLSELASAIALDLCESSEKGRQKSGLYTLDSIHAEFPDQSLEQVTEAVGEILHYGLVSKGPTSHTMITPEYPLFWLFDPISKHSTDPVEDAKTLARETLNEPTFNSRKLIEVLNWTTRRFNPALAYMINEIGHAFIISRESTRKLKRNLSCGNLLVNPMTDEFK